MKIGLFGGSFDPIHIGHLILAEYIINNFRIDKIIFIPSGDPVHKKAIANPIDRYFMTILGIENNINFEVSEIELNGNLKYSIDTISYFKEKYPNDEIFFIIGLDSFYNLHTWKTGLNILKSCNFLIVNRVYNEKIIVNKEKFIGEKNLFFIDDFNIDISSTKIRNLVKNNQKISYLVPKKVENYIYENRLYKDDKQ